MSAPELLPCPFCGGRDVRWHWNETYSLDSSYATFGCKSCGAAFIADDVGVTNDDIAAWNARPDAILSDPRVLALVEARSSHIEAVERYNTKLAEVTKRRAAGDWSQNVHVEYQAMEDFRRDFYAAAQNFADAALARVKGGWAMKWLLLAIWKIQLWHKHNLLYEAAKMTRAHWNIAQGEMDDHMRRKPK